MKFSYIKIYPIIMFLSIIFISLFNTHLSPIDITFIGIGIIGIITYIFEIKHYQNKLLYFSIISIIIALVLIITNYQISTQTYSDNIMSYYIATGIFVSLVGLMIILLIREMKIYQKMVVKYDNALKINPEDITALNNRGTALISLKKYREAMKCFEKAMEIDPRDAAVWHNKGVTLEKLRKNQEALKYYDKALELDPNFKISKKSGKIILES